MSTLTMQDIADLANVRRPVVSMWRKRTSVRGVSMPFPSPSRVVDGLEQFEKGDIVEWLERTGRGKNREVGLDAAALAVPDGATVEDIVTLLCWCAMTGEDLMGTSHDDRIAGAARHDPDDVLLLGEIRALRADAAVLEFVDDLIGASYGLPDALARVDRGRLTRALGVRDLTADAIDLVRCVTGACATYLGEGVALVGDGPLSLAVCTGFDNVVISDNGRAMRRRAVIMGLPLSDARPRVSVTVTSLVGLDPIDALERADQLVVDLAHDDVAVVLGPASVLCDDLSGPLQQRRAETLRVADLVAAVRLPRGMWREAHRQSLGLWVCLGGADVQFPLVADLGAEAVHLDDLAADIAGALAQSPNRAYRYFRSAELQRVLAGGALVPRGVRALRLRGDDAQSHVDRIHGATLTTTTPLSTLDVLVAPSPGRLRLKRRSLGELRAAGLVSMKRGSRIDPVHASPDGTVPVLPEDELRLDPFDAAQKYPRATRTDPGDVIFVERPLPRAWVDSAGGSLVASPARILRRESAAEFGPYLLATVINEMSPAGSEWETWSVPELTREEADRLEAVLIEAEQYEREVRKRGDAVRELRTALIDGVAAGALTLDAKPTTPGIAVAQH